MARLLLIVFAVYQVSALESNSSFIANGPIGVALAIIAIIVLVLIFMIRHERATAFSPWYNLLW